MLDLLDLGDGVPSVTLKTKDESGGPSPKNMASLSNLDRSTNGICGDVPGEGDCDLVWMVFHAFIFPVSLPGPA